MITVPLNIFANDLVNKIIFYYLKLQLFHHLLLDSSSPELSKVAAKNEGLPFIENKPDIKIRKGKITIPPEYKELPSARKPRRKRSRKKNTSEIYQ